MKRFFILLIAVIVLAGLTILAAVAFGASANVERYALIAGMIAVVIVFFFTRR